MKRITTTIGRHPTLIFPIAAEVFALVKHVSDGNISAVCGWAAAITNMFLLIYILGLFTQPIT